MMTKYSALEILELTKIEIKSEEQMEKTNQASIYTFELYSPMAIEITKLQDDI